MQEISIPAPARTPHPRASLVSGAFLALALLTLPAAELQAKAPPGGPRPAAVQYRDFDYAPVDGLYSHFVTDGLVDYAAWKKAGTAPLDSLLAGMNAWPGLREAPERMRLAFLINVYNLTVIRAVLDHYPVKSVKEIPGFFDGTKHPVAGGSFTLDELEKTIIKPLAGEDGLYHFGLVCGARGCPRLRAWAFQADSLGSQLFNQTQAFLADPTKARLDDTENVLYVSELFRWYIRDFEKGDYTLPRAIGPYFSLSAAMKFSQLEPEVRYLDYDWSLNDTGTSR